MADRTTLIEALLREYEHLNARMADFSGPTFLGLDITMAQAKVLFLIRATGSIQMSDLVARLGVTVPTVTGIVDRLVERDLVVRRGTPDDRRRVVVEITPGGVELIDGMRDFSARQLQLLLDVMDEAELETFLGFLRVLDGAVARVAATGPGAGVPAVAGGAL
jgi:DNA-binding MarR family transcriptional regulator